MEIAQNVTLVMTKNIDFLIPQTNYVLVTTIILMTKLNHVINVIIAATNVDRKALLSVRNVQLILRENYKIINVFVTVYILMF